MDADLNEVLVFVKVVEAGAFTAAADALSVPKSTVSRKVAALEQRLGARLLERTTRKLRLTEAGEVYYPRARQIVRDLEDADQAVAKLQDKPRGTLRVTAPVEFGEAFLPEILIEFSRLHPEVNVDLDLTGRIVDLVDEGYDLAIRPGPLPDSSMVARKLGLFTAGLYAAPSYLEARGTPSTLEELAQHCAVLFTPLSARGEWTLVRDGESRRIPMRARLGANHFAVVHAATVAGLGIAWLPPYMARPDVETGRLIPILGEWALPTAPLYVVYPSSRGLTAKTRAFLDLLSERLSPPPW